MYEIGSGIRVYFENKKEFRNVVFFPDNTYTYYPIEEETKKNVAIFDKTLDAVVDKLSSDGWTLPAELGIYAVNLNAVFDTKVSVNLRAWQNGKATVFRFSSGSSVWSVRWSPAGGLNCRRSAYHNTEPSLLCPLEIIERCKG